MAEQPSRHREVPLPSHTQPPPPPLEPPSTAHFFLNETQQLLVKAGMAGMKIAEMKKRNGYSWVPSVPASQPLPGIPALVQADR